ncbi:MAG TPA: hypothetical protein VJ964_07650 [Balneolaceae bacterium]|nr:hypothetical protein [Balneolaceae bacterium]
MPEESPQNNESSNSPNYLVRVLLIVAIGIPVILEFLTFFNLIKFRLWDESSPSKQEQVQTTEKHAHEFSIGDTLLVDSPMVLTLEDLRINVNPETWKLEVKLRAIGTSKDFKFSIDSLRLENGMTVPVKEISEQESENESGYREIEGEWTIPNREVPSDLFVTVYRKISADSTSKIHKRFPITKPIVRYNN